MSSHPHASRSRPDHDSRWRACSKRYGHSQIAAGSMRRGHTQTTASMQLRVCLMSSSPALFSPLSCRSCPTCRWPSTRLKQRSVAWSTSSVASKQPRPRSLVGERSKMPQRQRRAQSQPPLLTPPPPPPSLPQRPRPAQPRLTDRKKRRQHNLTSARSPQPAYPSSPARACSSIAKDPSPVRGRARRHCSRPLMIT